MTSQPEKLFRDKLENFQQTAPTSAWQRIEHNLDQKKRTGLWLKAAAVILLLVTAGIILWPASDHGNTQSLTQSKSEAPAVQSEENPKIKQSLTQSTEEPITQESTKRKHKIRNTPKPEAAKTVVPENSNPENSVIENGAESPAIAVLETNSTEVIPSRTIVYTAEEVNAKFLKKKKSAKATPEEKKPSGIQKLMGLAADLKNNEDGLGDLRQKKDEILALNFLKEDKPTKEKN